MIQWDEQYIFYNQHLENQYKVNTINLDYLRLSHKPIHTLNNTLDINYKLNPYNLYNILQD